MQIYYTRITQAGSPSTAADRSHERCELAKRRHTVPQERSLPRRRRIAQPSCQLDRQRPTIRDLGCGQDEVLSFWYARAALRSQ